MATEFSITYTTVTEESAEHGDYADAGFLVEDVSLRDAMAALRNVGACGAMTASSWPFDPHYPYGWFETAPETNFRTGEEITYSLHLPRDLSPATRMRIAKLVGAA